MDDDRHRRILELFARYCRSLDKQDLPAFRDQFWPDAVLGSPLVGGDFHGHDGLAAFFERLHGNGDFAQFHSGQHTTGNLIVEEAREDEVRTWSQFQLYVPVDGKPQISAYGEYHDRITQLDGQWRFARRDIVLLATG